jgi:SAM-dependent methyltransferase
MLLLLQGQLHKAPIENPRRILDIGTGTGIWAIDMADRYPSSKVHGIDLSPIQPKWVPSNCRFTVDDAEGDWSSKSVCEHFISRKCRDSSELTVIGRIRMTSYIFETLHMMFTIGRS